MKKALIHLLVLILANISAATVLADIYTTPTPTPIHKPHPQTLTRFDNMYAVEGAFVTAEGQSEPNIRGIVGDSLPWKINKHIKGALRSDGLLTLEVKGLVFPDAPNDESNFRALVSCLTTTYYGNYSYVVTQNVITEPFPTGPKGDAKIKTHLELPTPCVAPIIMILNGDAVEGDKWFAVTGM